MSFRFVLEPTWPKLAWIAKWKTSDTVVVHHGRRVEVNDDWFGEIVWDGDYWVGDFHRTDIVFGSGVRKLSNNDLFFVSSGMTTDRLHRARLGQMFFVSNSLPCLLENLGGKVLPSYTHYGDDFKSITGGYTNCVNSIATSAGDVHLTYYRNLRFSDGRLAEVEKPVLPRDLSTYERYRCFLEDRLVGIGRNMRDPGRVFPYDFLGTISTGFDSPTVTALARKAGLNEAITFNSARGGADDSGEMLGDRLGVKTIRLDRDAWRSTALAEVPFLASDAKGEDVYFAGASGALDGRVLLTGFAAGAWSRRKQVDEVFRRADQSGLSLTEYRLHAGFIHVPVPVIGSRMASDQHAMMHSAEMDPWCSGQKYDKPFCRRVLVEAGLREGDFGEQKKAASVLLFDRRTFLADASRSDFELYLERMCQEQPGFRRVFYSHRARSGLRSKLAWLAQGASKSVCRVVPHDIFRRAGSSLRLRELSSHEPLFDFLFPWATSHAQRHYSGS